MSHNTPQARQDAPGATITPELVRQAGYTPIPIHPDTRAIARRWEPGLDIDVPAGLQPDGTYLHLIDLDSHTPTQDAGAQLARIKKRVGTDLAGRLAIRRSRSGEGYHIIYRTTTPHSTYGWIKVYDPLEPDRHIGELIGPGQRVTLTGEWVQHGPAAIPLLSALELDQLRAAIHTPALYTLPNAPGSPESEPADHAPRKERMAEGLSLIAGWEHVTNPQQKLETLADRHSQLEQRLREMRRTPKDRSAGYCHLVQSLMLHAAGLGNDLAERCRVVAALAIQAGAAGKEHEKTYKIVNDTATLIARILHGDRFLNEPDLHFTIPRWASGAHIPRPAAPTRAQAAPRTPHPHAADRQKNITKLLRYVRKLPPDDCGQRYTSLADLAEHLRVSRRTVQYYLADLRDQAKIVTGQHGKNGALFILICEPPKAAKNQRQHARQAENEPQTTTETPTDRSASQKPESPTPAPESIDQTSQCIEELGAPRGCAPVSRGPADDQAAPAAASYDPAGDLIACAPKRRRARKDPIRARLDEVRQRVERLRAMSLPRLLRERETLANAARDPKRSRKQRQKFLEMLPEIDHEIGRKRDQALQAMYAAAQAAPPADDQAAPPADDQAAPVVYGPLDNDQAAPPMVEQPAPEPALAPGITRRVWRSPFVRCDWEPVPFVPHKVAHEPHPIATLGTDPESMRVAHEYCAAVLARSGDGDTRAFDDNPDDRPVDRGQEDRPAGICETAGECSPRAERPN